jgi:Undecaprenyl-phosphate glucose phosphotransferase
MLVLNRLLLTYITEFIFKKVVVKRKVLIVGDNTPGRQLANYFEKNKSFYSLTGIFDNKTLSDNNGLYKGKLESCIDFAAKNHVNYIYSTIFPDEDEHILELKNVAENNCIHMLFVGKNKPPVDNRYYRIHFIEAMPVMSLRAEPLLRQRNILRKRVFDIVFSAIVILLLMSWLTPLIAILIKLSSKGPIFFVQQRSGKDNKPFWCYKFRSMRVNDNSDTHQATRGDSRITRIGAFMRKTSIDELPQFFNVLIGNMSIVGPRPHMLKHTEEYSAIIDKYLVRHYLKPGITGWAQVNGYRGETINVALMEKRVEYDIAYMENWSLMQDVKIVFMTIINVLKGEENAR